MSSTLRITFNGDGTVTASLDEDIPKNMLLFGLATTLGGFIAETAPNDEQHNRAVDIIVAKLNRYKK